MVLFKCDSDCQQPEIPSFPSCENDIVRDSRDNSVKQ